MEEQFILRVPPNVAKRIERLLNENNASSSKDKSLNLIVAVVIYVHLHQCIIRF
ncbi:hypothetical protein JHK87_039959 [Glycine soja]|nr:hypothetical protein JHK87_039959 [Glycine soja]